MSERDARRITIAAPSVGGRVDPPPRRTPEVVLPTPSSVGDPSPVVRSGASVFDPVADAGATEALPTSPGRADQLPSPAAPPASSTQPPGRVVVGPGSPPPRVTDGSRATAATAPKRQESEVMASRPSTKPTRRRSPKKIALSILAVFLLLVAGTFAWSYSKFKSIETVELANLSSENGTNYLIVGSDSRDGVDPNAPNAAVILGDDSVGGPQRSDTIMILRVDAAGTRTLSVPRDLLVTISETGSTQRINAAFNGGPDRLIATLQDQLGIPIQHYLEINFVAFADMVDAVGGITIDFEHPAFDVHSGLDVPEAGPQNLDGIQALAYVRSRFYTEVIDGRDVAQGNGDIGRVIRQQQFLGALSGAIAGTKNPFTLASTASALAGGMRIDSDLGYFAALNLVRKMRSLDPEPNALPTSNGRFNGADILNLVQPGADEVLAEFGSDGATIG